MSIQSKSVFYGRSLRKALLFAVLFLVLAAGLQLACIAAEEKPTDWIKGTNIYQLRVKSFASDAKQGETPLLAITRHLQDIFDMGIKTVWLMPVFTSPLQDDGYDVADYKAINPEYGTIEDLKNLVAKAHALGMKVILDLPTNHCSKDNPLFCSKDDTIRKDDWFIWSESDKGWPKPWEKDDGEYHPGKTWFKDPTGLDRGYFYAVFSDYQPDFNYNDPKAKQEVFDYFVDVIKFWIDKCDIDGFRCDAARYLVEDGSGKQKDLPATHTIWRETRSKVDKLKPSFFLLAEAATETDNDLLAYYGKGDEFNSSLHFRFPSILMNTIKKGSRQANFFSGLLNIQDNLPDEKSAAQACQDSIFLSNHDDFVGSRVATQLNGGLNKEKAAASLYLLLSGIPVIYYGEEIGVKDVSGVKYPTRGTLNWDVYNKEKANPDSLLNHYTRLLKFRDAYDALKLGKTSFVSTGYGTKEDDTSSLKWDNSLNGESPVMSIMRSYEKQNILVVHNFSSNTYYLYADIGKAYVGSSMTALKGDSTYPDVTEFNSSLYPLGKFAPLETKVIFVGFLPNKYVTYENVLATKK